MNMRHQINVYKDYLCVHVTGEFSMDEAIAHSDEVLKVLIETGATKLLINLQEMKCAPGLFNRLSYIEYLTREHMKLRKQGSPPIMLAFVGFTPVIDPERIGEVMARNRGMIVKATTNEPEALDWLKVAKSK